MGWDTKKVQQGELSYTIFFLLRLGQVKFNKSHAWVHPRIAVRNAKKITSLNKKEEDIILKHMWGLTLAPPRYKESFLVTMVDKYWAFKEASEPIRKKVVKEETFPSKNVKIIII